jgi:hypothetical protein
MGFFVNREGGVSIFRVGSVVAVVGILAILGGILSFTLDQSSRKQALVIEPFPGAVLISEQNLMSNVRERLYQISSVDPAEVADFYDRSLADFYGVGFNDLERDRCVRIPGEGNALGYQPGTDQVPYFFTCMFDNAGFFASQNTRIVVQPGILALNTEGTTLIQHVETWEP